MFDIIFFTVIAFMMCVMYFAVYFVAPRFFEKSSVPLVCRQTLPSLAMILVFSFVVIYISLNISDVWLANRIQHALGGGFLATTVSFLAVRDSKIKLSYFQFIFATLMLVTLLGVGNEVVEFLGQNYLGLDFANSINDTWLDLISNLVGIVAGLAVFTPMLKRNSL